MRSIETREEFDKIISGSKRALIKFTAGWCPDCKRLDMFIGPIIEEYNEFVWYEMNRDNFPELAEKYQVMGIPSLLVFKNGEKMAHLHSANAKTPEDITEYLETVPK
ncbi:MAG TPA: thioredoxin family protein [Candidatus Angelobacter sp.]|nr:thioredoxin family protein [Candidatus Angelobacter sp.]